MVLPHEWDVPEVFRERLGEAAGRQRTMEADGHLLLVLHRVPTPGESRREGALFWRGPTGEWHNTGRGTGIGGLRHHVEEFARAAEQLEDDLDSADAAADYYRVLQAAAPLHRTASHLLAVLQSAREIAQDDRDLIVLRDRAGEVERAADLLHADAVHGMDYCIAQRSEEITRINLRLTETANRINAMAALFLPLSAIAAIFGMNLPHGLGGVTSPVLFWAIFAVGLGLGVVLQGLLARQRAPRADDAGEARAARPRNAAGAGRSPLPASPRARV